MKRRNFFSFFWSLWLFLSGRGTQSAPRLVSGKATVIDGDGLRIGRHTIRIAGIDAPEWNQPHGRAAKRALASLVRSRRVRCEVTGTDRYGRTLARCYVGDIDIGRRMVQGGHAWAFMSNRYRSEQMAAEAAGRGLWGRWRHPVEPWVWRKK